MPRTAADELPPYREQPWIIDRGGYRKIDPSMTLVPVTGCRALALGGPYASFLPLCGA